MQHILDADWMIQTLAGRVNAGTVLERLAGRRVAISVLTVGEVFESAFSSPNPQPRIERLRRFLHPYYILSVTEPVIQRFAEIRAYLRHRGELISDFDIIIGATALHYDLTVLPFNLRRFLRVPDLRIFTPDA
jgi:predicted nucleic acid-binding protein